MGHSSLKTFWNNLRDLSVKMLNNYHQQPNGSFFSAKKITKNISVHVQLFVLCHKQLLDVGP